MKKLFDNPELKVLRVDIQNIIVTSIGDPREGDHTIPNEDWDTLLED